MILGVGDGTFAILLVTALGIIGTLVGIYIAPRMGLLIGAVFLALPVIVYGCILSVHNRRDAGSAPPTSYIREEQLLPNSSVIDYYFPVRIVVMIVLIIGLIAGLGYHLVLIVTEPPYKAPRVRCLREQLEEVHPTLYR